MLFLFSLFCTPCVTLHSFHAHWLYSIVTTIHAWDWGSVALRAFGGCQVRRTLPQSCLVQGLHI